MEQHRTRVDCALKRDADGEKEILTEHINGCVAHAVQVGRLR